MMTQDTNKKLSSTAVVAGIVLIVALAAIPLFTVQGTEFGGSDGVGTEIVTELAPDYDSGWVSNIWAPPGGETESMLFALQAAAGGILIGYFFGFKRGQTRTGDNQ